MNWNNYLDKTKAIPPRPLLVEALRYVKNHDTALDLGCGAMNDTREIFNSGFSAVDAIDSNPSITSIADDFVSCGFNLKFYPTTYSDFSFLSNHYNLINAQYSLPFTNPDGFLSLWDKIEDCLSHGGIFTGQFFGPEDTWANRPSMTFLTKVQVANLFPANKWKLHKLDETKNLGKTASGETKMWHVFHVIAEKI